MQNTVTVYLNQRSDFTVYSEVEQKQYAYGFFNFCIKQRLLCVSHEIVLDVQTAIR